MSAQVSWWPATSSPDGNCISGYVVTPSSGTPLVVFGKGTTTVVKGLTNGTSYTFTIAAFNASGVGPASDAVTVTAGTPTAATAVKAAHAGKGAIKVAFKSGSNNGAVITKFTATCGPKSASGKASPLIVKGLAAGKRYGCTVTATNSRGTGASTRSASAKA